MNNSSVIEKEEKERSLKELLGSAIVDIYVGPHKQHWPIHEKLLCYHSKFFARIFSEDSSKSCPSPKFFTLPDEDDEQPFTMIIVWLYSRSIRKPAVEDDIGALLDLYLIANKFEMPTLEAEVVDAAREFYCSSSTYPALRRVQYVYANTTENDAMREMIVSNVARQLVTKETVPAHWAKALQRNGQLAFDVVRAIRQRNVTKDSSTGKDIDGSDDEEFGKISKSPSPEQPELVAGTRNMNDLRVPTRRRGLEIPPTLAKPEFAVLGIAWLLYALYYYFA